MNKQDNEPSIKATVKRAFVGNLNNTSDVEDRVRALFSRSAIPVRSVKIVPLKQPNTKCYALVECDVDMAIKCLRGMKFDGGLLSVQHERKTGNASTSKSKGFGGGWAAPNHSPIIFEKPIPSLSKQMKDMSLLHETKITQDGMNAIDSAGVKKMIPSTSSSDDVSQFHSRCKLSLDNLLQEYGSYDPDYERMKARQVESSQSSSVVTAEDKSHTQSIGGMLASNGRAPIHVEVVSFGYKYSVPPQAREGWSHSNPLSPIDCRDLPRCPHYVAKLSGLNHKVKRAMLRMVEKDDCDENSDTECDVEESPTINPLVEKSEEVSESIISALEEAINEGGHGYAFPLEVTIFLGSEYGRHRSVVLCETVAQKIRNLLRRNEGARISQPVSVSTRHRDVDKKHKDEEAFGVDLRREHDAEMKLKKKQECLGSGW